jgi:hypothetical protein
MVELAQQKLINLPQFRSSKMGAIGKCRRDDAQHLGDKRDWNDSAVPDKLLLPCDGRQKRYSGLVAAVRFVEQLEPCGRPLDPAGRGRARLQPRDAPNYGQWARRTIALRSQKTAVEIRYQIALKDLVKIDDEIVGAVLTTPTGQHALHARNGVILATGGIGWSQELRERLPLAKYAAIVGKAIARNTNCNRSSLNGERPRGKGRSRARVDEAIVHGQVIWVIGCSMVCPIGWRGARGALEESVEP